MLKRWKTQANSLVFLSKLHKVYVLHENVDLLIFFTRFTSKKRYLAKIIFFVNKSVEKVFVMFTSFKYSWKMFCLFVYWQIQINNFYILKFVVSASSLRIFIFFGGTFSPSRGFRFLPLILPNFKYHSLLLLLINI